MDPLTLALGAGASYLAYKYLFKAGGPSGIDAMSAHTTSYPGTVPTTVTVPGPQGPTTTVVNAPVLTPPVTAQTPSAAPPVVTLQTATEAPQTLRVVSPAKQPKVPSAAVEQSARALAPTLAAALVSNPAGPNYITSAPSLVDLVKQFQGFLGLVTDGLYGPQTAGALMYFLGSAPPPPFFYGTGERTLKVYLPTP